MSDFRQEQMRRRIERSRRAVKRERRTERTIVGAAIFVVLAWLAFWVAVIVIALHFIGKFW